MLVSAGDDAKLFAYSVQEFTKFPPHDICPAPQRVPMRMVHNTVFNQASLLLVQYSCSLDILRIQISSDYSGSVSTKSFVRVKNIDSRKIICSTISNSGALFAYSDQIRPRLFELKQIKIGKNPRSANRKQLLNLPFAPWFSAMTALDCLLLAMIEKIYIVDIDSMELLHTYTPRQEGESPSCEPPITKLYSSSDDQCLAAINCFGDIYVFNLETQRLLISMTGSIVAAVGFHPRDKHVFVISTSSNRVFALDVETRELGKWSLLHTFCLPKSYQEFPGEVVRLSFSPSPSSSSVIIYSSSARCLIEFGKLVEQDKETDLAYGNLSEKVLGVKSRKKIRKCSIEEYQK